MPPDEGTSGVEVAASLAPASPASTDPPPAPDVRQAPEYQELQEQNRQLARQAGTLRAENERFRQQAMAERQAAEAQRAEVQRQEMLNVLGPAAPEFAQVAQLLQHDPVAAARRFAELTSAQSAQVPPQPEATVPVQEEPVASTPPANPGIGVQASAPLGVSPQQTRDQVADAAQRAFEEVAARNANLQTRARVSLRDRAAAMGNLLKAGYIRGHGIDPEIRLRPPSETR